MTHKVNGPGGSSGGFKQFFIGLGMMGVGFYLLLSKIMVSSSFGMGYSLYRFHNVANTGMNMNLTTGTIFIPMIIGIMWIFYDAKSIWGWVISLISLAAMIVGVLTSLKISMQHMTSFDLITILVLAFGGLGLFLRSLKNYDTVKN